MNFIEQSIPGVWIIQPKVYNDERGYFMESFKLAAFEEKVGHIKFVQDNESKSTYGVLRGLHAQSGETAQAKLVRVIRGSVIDVVVDMRENSPAFGQYLMVELSEENKTQLFVPRGLYHGFLVTSNEAVFSYKIDNPYNPNTEVSMFYADKTLGIKWPVAEKDLILSPKDMKAPLFENAVRF